MESFKEALKSFTQHVIKTAGIYTTIIGIFTYHALLDKDMPCTCREQTRDCDMYMALPFCVILVLMLWTDKTCMLALRYMCRKGDCNLCYLFGCRFLRGVLVSLLWVVSVYLDGDWYVCCQNDRSEEQSMLACKDKANKTPEDRRLIAELKNKSRVIGLPLLLGVVCAAALLSSVTWMKCCSDASKKRCKRNVYVKIWVKEKESLTKEAVRNTVTKKLKVHLNSTNNWEDYLDGPEIQFEQQSTETPNTSGSPSVNPNTSGSPSVNPNTSGSTPEGSSGMEMRPLPGKDKSTPSTQDETQGQVNPGSSEVSTLLTQDEPTP